MALMDTNSLGDVLLKVGMFVLVQALVYLILSKSSDVFSKDKAKKSLSFRPVRSVSIRRFMAALSDMPAGGEPSPSPRSPPSLTTTHED
ncbi:uncharacterized protein LOC116198835 [Punica granatum]|uniref:Uncharacterized protein n=2 Tax=Punica granatum TaxID=22663 RepID=A0A218WLF6_PUNGR|nr:uncharacterized protein LOC116198835 [Punica granatum]OWM73423.1 hypothetical protein CDL15_Pgr026522 [Punica granatum]PKI43140.1 hypothetical protein CRG98_036446 [Punica granatum]